MRRKVELYRVKENIDLTPKLFFNLVSSTLYEHRFGAFSVYLIGVGLDHADHYKTYKAHYDSIGCLTDRKRRVPSSWNIKRIALWNL